MRSPSGYLYDESDSMKTFRSSYDKESLLKPLSELEAAIINSTFETLIKFVVYGNLYVSPPCAAKESHPTDAVVIGYND